MCSCIQKRITLYWEWKASIKYSTECSMCFTIPSTATTEKVYTGKDRMLLQTSITEFHEKFNITEIQKLAFHFPHVHILGTYHCGKEHHKEFKKTGTLHRVLCQLDYA